MHLVSFRKGFQNVQRRCVVVHGAEGDGCIIVLVGSENLYGRLIVPVTDGLHTGHVLLIQHGGLDGVFDHSFAVQMEVKLHGTEPWIQDFPQMMVEILP